MILLTQVEEPIWRKTKANFLWEGVLTTTQAGKEGKAGFSARPLANASRGGSVVPPAQCRGVPAPGTRGRNTFLPPLAEQRMGGTSKLTTFLLDTPSTLSTLRPIPLSRTLSLTSPHI